jgi:hypothetical protein
MDLYQRLPGVALSTWTTVALGSALLVTRPGAFRPRAHDTDSAYSITAGRALEAAAANCSSSAGSVVARLAATP